MLETLNKHKGKMLLSVESCLALLSLTFNNINIILGGNFWIVLAFSIYSIS